MNQNQLAANVRHVLKDIAPEADVEALDARHSFRDQLDIDSIDYLNFILALETELGIRIPDVDYPKLSSLSGCIAYLEAALQEPRGATAPTALVG